MSARQLSAYLLHVVDTVHDTVYLHRRVAAKVLYALISAASYAMAFLLRFDFRVPPEYAELFVATVLPLVAIRVAVFKVTGLTRERWRYASGHSLERLLLATMGGTLVLLSIQELVPLSPAPPLSVLAVEAVLTSWLTGGAWMGYRVLVHHFQPHERPITRRRVLIVGAGEAGHLLAQEMLRRDEGYVPVAFVDDSPLTWDSTIQGVAVMGATRDLSVIAARVLAEEIVLALPSAKPAELRRIVEQCELTGLPLRVLPAIRAVLRGEVRLHQLREVRIEDLLGREPIQLELPELERELEGCTVLITGAAGSIGSELSRQVALHRPAKLVLLDQAETDLFYLELELRARHPDLELVLAVGDIVDRAGMRRLFELHAPERVFHAAAYKHVPMMEVNAREAIRNNVIGTWRMGTLAGEYGAGRFVLVSTDKAVRPSSVMGATKRLAELVILELQQRYADTSYGAVRFGNVLGSQGSVIPVFKQQIAEGKPLTVTHPETTRYFMTIPEAVQLILQASLLEDLHGRIAMLEMGEPVRIVDLARNLLRLSGIGDDADRIVFTGLRPGEKLHEELSAADEAAENTAIPKVRLLRTPALASNALISELVAWDAAEATGDRAGFLAFFADLFPGVHLDEEAFVPGTWLSDQAGHIRIAGQEPALSWTAG